MLLWIVYGCRGRLWMSGIGFFRRCKKQNVKLFVSRCFGIRPDRNEHNAKKVPRCEIKDQRRLVHIYHYIDVIRTYIDTTLQPAFIFPLNSSSLLISSLCYIQNRE